MFALIFVSLIDDDDFASHDMFLAYHLSQQYHLDSFFSCHYLVSINEFIFKRKLEILFSSQ